MGQKDSAPSHLISEKMGVNCMTDHGRIAISPVKTIVAILVPIIELSLGTLTTKIPSDLGKVSVTVLIFLVGLLALLYLYGGVLKADWPEFRAHLWRNLGIAVLLTIGLYGVLSLVRLLAALHASSDAVKCAKYGDLKFDWQSYGFDGAVF